MIKPLLDYFSSDETDVQEVVRRVISLEQAKFHLLRSKEWIEEIRSIVENELQETRCGF